MASHIPYSPDAAANLFTLVRFYATAPAPTVVV